MKTLSYIQDTKHGREYFIHKKDSKRFVDFLKSLGYLVEFETPKIIIAK